MIECHSKKNIYHNIEKRMPFTIVKTILNKNAHQKPLTLNQGTISETKRINTAFITKVNNQIVSIFIGKVRTKTSGLIKVFTIHNTIATNKAGTNPVRTTQGRRYAVIITAIALTNKLIKADIMAFIKE
jgi:hypothetical protein